MRQEVWEQARTGEAFEGQARVSGNQDSMRVVTIQQCRQNDE